VMRSIMKSLSTAKKPPKPKKRPAARKSKSRKSASRKRRQ
jgi:hypothetical protein